MVKLLKQELSFLLRILSFFLAKVSAEGGLLEEAPPSINNPPSTKSENENFGRIPKKFLTSLRSSKNFQDEGLGLEQAPLEQGVSEAEKNPEPLDEKNPEPRWSMRLKGRFRILEEPRRLSGLAKSQIEDLTDSEMDSEALNGERLHSPDELGDDASIFTLDKEGQGDINISCEEESFRALLNGGLKLKSTIFGHMRDGFLGEEQIPGRKPHSADSNVLMNKTICGKNSQGTANSENFGWIDLKGESPKNVSPRRNGNPGLPPRPPFGKDTIVDKVISAPSSDLATYLRSARAELMGDFGSESDSFFASK